MIRVPPPCMPFRGLDLLRFHRRRSESEAFICWQSPARAIGCHGAFMSPPS